MNFHRQPCKNLIVHHKAPCFHIQKLQTIPNNGWSMHTSPKTIKSTNHILDEHRRSKTLEMVLHVEIFSFFALSLSSLSVSL